MTMQSWGTSGGLNGRLGLGALNFFDTQPTGRGGGAPVMSRIPQGEVSAAKALGERAVAAEVRAQTTLSPTSLKRGGIIAAVTAVLTPTNRTEPFTYQFAPDLRARQAIGETSVRFEKQVGGEWQRLSTTARMGAGGMDVDIRGLRADYGKPLPKGMTEGRNEGRPIPTAARALDTNNDGKLQCREIGTWVADKGRHSANSRAYQDYVTGKPSTVFEVQTSAKSRPVEFDGCTDTKAGPLLKEAKADHGNVLDPYRFENAVVGLATQGKDQRSAAVALNVRNEVRAQTAKDHVVIVSIYQQTKIATPVFLDQIPVIK